MLWGNESSSNKKFISQKATNNKIRIESVDLYRKTLSNSEWPEILTQCETSCVETPSKISARFDGPIESYAW